MLPQTSNEKVEEENSYTADSQQGDDYNLAFSQMIHTHGEIQENSPHILAPVDLEKNNTLYLQYNDSEILNEVLKKKPDKLNEFPKPIPDYSGVSTVVQ